MNTNLAQELLERHTVAINVAVEDGSCFMVSEQDALDAIRAALSHATSIDVQVGLPPLPPVDGYDKRIQGHYSAQQMQDYARAALAATGKQQGGEVQGDARAQLIEEAIGYLDLIAVQPPLVDQARRALARAIASRQPVGAPEGYILIQAGDARRLCKYSTHSPSSALAARRVEAILEKIDGRDAGTGVGS